MKPTYTKNISLTIVAFVVSLALSALANGPRDLLVTAAQNPGHATGQSGHSILQAPPGSLWYNGDFNGVNGLSNELNTSLGEGEFGSVYDDFNVTDSAGWHITSVFSDNLSNTNVVGANWEIRQGITEGNGGTLIASGTTSTPNVTLTGRSGFGYVEQQVEVDGLDVCLQQGTYFLNVTPIGDLTDRSFDSTTSGADCVGTPCGNNQNAFFNSNFFGANFTSTANFGQPYDFSMGVIGTVGCGGGGLTFDSAFSEQGTFDIPLPLDGSGVEDRSGGHNKKYSIFFVFGNDLASVGGATTSCGSVTSFGVDANVANQAVVELTGVNCNEQEITVSVNDVVDVDGNSLSSAPITFGLLVGDVNGDRVVDRADYREVKMHLGEAADSSNFRDDCAIGGHNTTGFINSADLKLVSKQQGTSLP